MDSVYPLFEQPRPGDFWETHTVIGLELQQISTAVSYDSSEALILEMAILQFLAISEEEWKSRWILWVIIMLNEIFPSDSANVSNWSHPVFPQDTPSLSQTIF